MQASLRPQRRVSRGRPLPVDQRPRITINNRMTSRKFDPAEREALLERLPPDNLGKERLKALEAAK